MMKATFFHLIIMISCLLSCAHQTHDRINVYHVFIISYLYPVLNHIMPLSYRDHQTSNVSYISGEYICINKRNKDAFAILM